MKTPRRVSITVLFYRDPDTKQVVAFAPALDLGACGNTIDEAKRQFTSALETFFDELDGMGTMEQALRSLGWRKQDVGMRPPAGNPPGFKVPTHLLARRQMPVYLPA